MKIAVIGVPGIPTNQEGIGRYCQELYPRIVARGHQVDLFVQAKYHHQPWFSIYYYKKIRVISLFSLPGKILDLLVSSALNTIWASFGDYDVIHIHGLKNAWFSWFPQLFSSSRIVVTCREKDWQQSKWSQIPDWLLRWGEKTGIKNTDAIVVTSKALGKYFKEKFDVSSCFIPHAAQYSGLETDNAFTFGKALGLEKKRYLLYVGKLVPEKRPDLLIKAFQQLQLRGWKLVLAGEICNSTRYTVELLKISGEHSNIIFTNKIKARQLEEIFRGAGLLVCPSDARGLVLPQTILAAMRAGIPVLASDLPVHQELVGLDRGLLFQSGQLNSLVTELDRALSKPQLLVSIIRQGQAYVESHHSWDTITEANLSLYFRMTANRGIPATKFGVLDNQF